MPTAPKKPCAVPNCGALTDGRYCQVHAKVAERKRERERGSAARRGYGRKWQRARRDFLNDNPLCVECIKEGFVVAATVVDHIKPHKGDQSLFWDRTNWQAMCKRHHDEKTAREDGGFGQRVRRG